MKKNFLFIMLFSLIASNIYAQDNTSFDITSPFKLWLLNNEAKAMSEMGCDDKIITRSSTPFSLLPTLSFVPKRAEEELWKLHRRFYAFFNEVQKIYNLSKLFGNGKLAVIIKKARPEVWSFSPFNFVGFVLPKTIYSETRNAFLDALRVSIGLDENRDKDLSDRLKTLKNSFKDEEYRMLKEYIAIFKALYPTDKSIVQLELFLNQGTQKRFATGLVDVINAMKNPKDTVNEDGVDSLSELETLTENSTKENSKPVLMMEETDRESADIYNIW